MKTHNSQRRFFAFLLCFGIWITACTLEQVPKFPTAVSQKIDLAANEWCQEQGWHTCRRHPNTVTYVDVTAIESDTGIKEKWCSEGEIHYGDASMMDWELLHEPFVFQASRTGGLFPFSRHWNIERVEACIFSDT